MVNDSLVNELRCCFHVATNELNTHFKTIGTFFEQSHQVWLEMIKTETTFVTALANKLGCKSISSGPFQLSTICGSFLRFASNLSLIIWTSLL
jgi:hypothetical protein